MKKNINKLNIEITELFVAKAGKNRYFMGTIKREKDENENQVLSSKIYVENEKFNEIIFAQVSNPGKTTMEIQNQLRGQLDEMVKLILDCGLTKMPEESKMLGEIKVFSN